MFKSWVETIPIVSKLCSCCWLVRNKLFYPSKYITLFLNIVLSSTLWIIKICWWLMENVLYNFNYGFCLCVKDTAKRTITYNRIIYAWECIEVSFLNINCESNLCYIFSIKARHCYYSRVFYWLEWFVYISNRRGWGYQYQGR